MDFIKKSFQYLSSLFSEEKKTESDIRVEKQPEESAEKDEEENIKNKWLEKLNKKYEADNVAVNYIITKIFSDVLMPEKYIKSTSANISEIKEHLKKFDINKRNFLYQDEKTGDVYDFPLDFFVMMIFWQKQNFELDKSMVYYIPQMANKHLNKIYEKNSLENARKSTVSQKLDILYKTDKIILKFFYDDRQIRTIIDKNNYPTEEEEKKLDDLVLKMYELNKSKTRCLLELGFSKLQEYSHATGLFYEIRNRKLFVSVYDPHGKNIAVPTTIEELEGNKILNPLFKKLAEKYKQDGIIDSSFIFYNSVEKYFQKVIGIQTTILKLDKGLCNQISFIWLFFMYSFSIVLDLEKSNKSVSEYMFYLEQYFDNKYTPEEIKQLLLELFTHLYIEYFSSVVSIYPDFVKTTLDKVLEDNIKQNYDDVIEFKISATELPNIKPSDWTLRLREITKQIQKQSRKTIEKRKTPLTEEEEKQLKKQKLYSAQEKFLLTLSKEDVGDKKKVGELCVDDNDCNTGCCSEEIEQDVKVCQIKETCDEKNKKRVTRSSRK